MDALDCELQKCYQMKWLIYKSKVRVREVAFDEEVS